MESRRGLRQVLRRKLGLARQRATVLGRRIYGAVAPLRQRRAATVNWESRWSQPDYEAPWMHTGVPPELRAAVEKNWFHPGGNTLDIGCGEGHVAAWMASQGFPSLGVDFAPSAIERARSQYEEKPGHLEYRVLDFVRGGTEESRFENLIDRGCFHIIPQRSREDFVRNVASAAAPGARLLLLMKASWSGEKGFVDASERKQICDMVTQSFSLSFEVERIEDIYMDRWDGKRVGREKPGVAFWMTRR